MAICYLIPRYQEPQRGKQRLSRHDMAMPERVGVFNVVNDESRCFLKEVNDKIAKQSKRILFRLFVSGGGRKRYVKFQKPPLESSEMNGKFIRLSCF